MRALALIGALAGLTTALLYLAGVIGAPLGPLLMAAAPLPLFIAALGWGNLAGLLAGVSATLIVGATGGAFLGLTFALSAAAPAIWLSRLALLNRTHDPARSDSPLEWYPAGRLLLWLAGFACGGFIILEILLHVQTGHGLSGQIASFMTLNVPEDSELRKLLLAEAKTQNWGTLVHLISTVAPAFAGVGWQVMIAVNGIGALAILAAAGHSIRPGTGWQSLALPKVFFGLFLLCLAVSLAVPALRYGAATLAALLFVPYFFLGLSVLHAIPVRGPRRVLLLGLFYLLLVVFSVWPAVIVGLLGLGEQWSGLRARFFAASGREDK